MSYLWINDDYRNGVNYDGIKRKFAVTIGDTNYMVKDPLPDDRSIYNEYICSELLWNLGLESQTAQLGRYKDRTVVVLDDFCDVDFELRSYRDLLNSKLDDPGVPSNQAEDYTYQTILRNLRELSQVSSTRQSLVWRFIEMMIADAILGNSDRHAGNWGYLVKTDTTGPAPIKVYKAAPIYDNGAGLFPNIYRKLDQGALTAETDKEFMYDHTIKFPASLIKVGESDDGSVRGGSDNGTCGKARRTSFYNVFESILQDPQLKIIVSALTDDFTIPMIFDQIDKIVRKLDIKDIYKYFYCKIVCLRFACIVCRIDFDEAYECIEEFPKMSVRRLLV